MTRRVQDGQHKSECPNVSPPIGNLVRIPASDCELGLSFWSWDNYVKRMAGRVKGCLEQRRAVRELRVSTLGVPIVDNNLNGLPPRRIRTLARAEIHAHRAVVRLALEFLTEKFALLVAESMTIIEVD